MVSTEKNVYLVVRRYAFALEMASIMVYIRCHMHSMYSKIDMVIRHMNIKVNCFCSQVDTATTNIP